MGCCLLVFASTLPQANLTADTPPDGTLGFAADTGEFSVRTGGAWAALSNQGVTIGVAPTNPLTGNLWLDTANAAGSRLMVYDGTNWVPARVGVHIGATAPANPVAGDAWMDTSGAAPVMKFWSGSAWVEAGGKQITVGPIAQRPNPMDDGSIYMESDNVHAIWAKQPGRSPIILNQGTLIKHAENLSVVSTDTFNMGDFHTAEVELVLHPGHDTDLFLTINESDPTANGGTFHHQTVFGNGGGWRDTQSNGQFGSNGIFIGLCDPKSQWPAFVRMTLMSPRNTSIPPTVFCTGYNISKA